MQHDDVSEAQLDSHRFKAFWLNLAGGLLSVGAGSPGAGAVLLQLPVPVASGPLFVGLHSWDTHVAYRCITMQEPLATAHLQPPFVPRPGSLLAASFAQLERNLQPRNAAAALCCLAQRWGPASPAWSASVAVAARNLLALLQHAPQRWCQLPPVAIKHIYAHGDVCVHEVALFLALESWAAVRAPAWAQAPADSWQYAPAPQPSALRADADADALHALSQAVLHIRFPLMQPQELQRVQASPLVQCVPALRQLLAEAHAHHRDVNGATPGMPASTDAALPGGGVDSCESNRLANASTASAMSDCTHMDTGSRPGTGLCRPDGCHIDSGCLAQWAAADDAVLHSPRSHTASQLRLPPASPAPAPPAAAAATPLQPLPAARTVSLDSLWRAWRAQWRLPSQVTEIAYMHDRNQSGVMHHLGCLASGGCGRFMNPQRAGAVEVTSSSPFNRDSEPSQLVSHEYRKMACALPDRHGDAFWAVQLLAGRSLACQHYSLRANGSACVPSAWSFKGRQSGQDTWQALHEVSSHHEHGYRFVRPGQCLTMEVQQQSQPQYFDEFQVVASAPGAHGSCTLNVCQLELFGYLT